MGKKRIAIIGAGLGGLSAAIRLANAGFEVDVFEQNDHVGGKAGSINLNGFRFDTGPSLLTMPHVLEELFRESNEKLEDYIQLQRLDTICKYFYSDGTIVNAYSDLNLFGEEIEKNTIDNRLNLKKYFEYSKKIYELTADLFLYKSPQQLSTYLSAKALKTLFQIKSIDPFRTVHQANSDLFKDKNLVQLFDRYATYNGSNPYLAPATLNIIPHVEYTMGSFIPKNGIYSISKVLKSLAEKKGVKFHLNSKIDKIEINNQTVKGVVINGKCLSFDIIISNVDVLTTYQNLIPDHSEKIIEKFSRHDISTSAIVFYWGVKGKHDKLEIHNILFSEDYNKEFDDIFTNKKLHDDPTIYVYVSSKYNPSDAPAECENWFAMINTPQINGQNWDEEVKRFRNIILDKIKKTLSIDLTNNIITENVLSPPKLEKQTGSYRGSIYGISSNDRFAAFLRHPNFSRKISSLYFCGGSVHPGGGIPLVILSGRITADLIRKKYL
jgi:phytoene desaturase